MRYDEADDRDSRDRRTDVSYATPPQYKFNCRFFRIVRCLLRRCIRPSVRSTRSELGRFCVIVFPCWPGSSSWMAHGALTCIAIGDEAHASLSWGGTPNTRPPSWCVHCSDVRCTAPLRFFILSRLGHLADTGHDEPVGLGMGKGIGESNDEDTRQVLQLLVRRQEV